MLGEVEGRETVVWMYCMRIEFIFKKISKTHFCVTVSEPSIICTHICKEIYIYI